MANATEKSDVINMAHRVETKRQWLSGLAITLTTLVCLFGFWRLSPGITLTIATISLVALLFFFWLAGKDAEKTNESSVK